jgi:hypothetical protein
VSSKVNIIFRHICYTGLHTESKLVEGREAREAERLDSQLNKFNVKRQVTQKTTTKDEREVKIDKLKQVNLKLR